MKDKYNYRPRIKIELTEPLLKLSDNLGLTAQSIVNICVKVGLQVLERSSEEIITDIQNKLQEYQNNESIKSEIIKKKNKTNEQ